jgi:uncharacterized membrane protein
MQRPPRTSQPRALAWAAGVIGFALSGFFDGILLHQLLQWHHLFSLVPGDAWRDIRNQILVDGLFHVLMYLVAAIGLVLLWRARGGLARGGAGRQVAGGALLGFGIWNVVDVVGFHWLIGIHRIRVGVPDPMLYDLGWLAAFAVPFILAGWWLLRRRGGGSPGTAAAAMLALVTPAAGTVASLPPAGGRTAVALFEPGDGSAPFAAAAAADARLLWIDRGNGLAAFAADRPLVTARLYAGGALMVSRSSAVAGV